MVRLRGNDICPGSAFCGWREAFSQGYYDSFKEQCRDLLEAMRVLEQNPLIFPPPMKELAVYVKSDLTIAKDQWREKENELRQRAKGAALKCKDPQTFLSNLIVLDCMPGAKHTRHLRSFFVCAFTEYLKTSHAELIARMISFCSGEKMTAGAARRARTDFSRSFPNWRGVAKRLLKALQASPAKPRPLA